MELKQKEYSRKQWEAKSDGNDEITVSGLGPTVKNSSFTSSEMEIFGR